MTTRSLAHRAWTAGSLRGAPAGVVAVLGLIGLLLRSSILTLPSETRVLALAMLFVAIAFVALRAPVPASTARTRPAVVLAVGAGAVLITTAAVAPVAPAPLGPWALPLALLAAVAEEALFRRALYGWLEPIGPAVAVAATAAAFALLHLPLYGTSALPVDLGAGLLLSWQRWASGTWTVPAATHGLANVLAVSLR
ncbi:MAG: CPBP family glutamic-type intramembrane protease [Actinomycetota bacterium]